MISLKTNDIDVSFVPYSKTSCAQYIITDRYRQYSFIKFVIGKPKHQVKDEKVKGSTTLTERMAALTR